MILFSALVRQHQRRFLKAAHREIHSACGMLPAKKSGDELVEDGDVAGNTSGRFLQFALMSFDLVNASSYTLCACTLTFIYIAPFMKGTCKLLICF